MHSWPGEGGEGQPRVEGEGVRRDCERWEEVVGEHLQHGHGLGVVGEGRQGSERVGEGEERRCVKAVEVEEGLSPCRDRDLVVGELVPYL